MLRNDLNEAGERATIMQAALPALLLTGSRGGE